MEEHDRSLPQRHIRQLRCSVGGAVISAAVAAGLLSLAALWPASPPENDDTAKFALSTSWTGNSEAMFDEDSAREDRNNPFKKIGNAFHFFDVKGFDDDSLHRRVRLDAADQDANAALQWQNAQRLRREREDSGSPSDDMVVAPRTPERAPRRHYDPDEMWVTPFRKSEAASDFRAMAPPGFHRQYADTFGGDGREKSGNRGRSGGGSQGNSGTVRQRWASGSHDDINYVGMWPD
jgi:hypothetical protein